MGCGGRYAVRKQRARIISEISAGQVVLEGVIPRCPTCLSVPGSAGETPRRTVCRSERNVQADSRDSQRWDEDEKVGEGEDDVKIGRREEGRELVHSWLTGRSTRMRDRERENERECEKGDERGRASSRERGKGKKGVFGMVGEDQTSRRATGWSLLAGRASSLLRPASTQHLAELLISLPSLERNGPGLGLAGSRTDRDASLSSSHLYYSYFHARVRSPLSGGPCCSDH